MILAASATIQFLSAVHDAVRDALKAAANGPMKNILQYTEESLVSSDFKGNSHSSIVDSQLTFVLDNMVKIFSWYDNEWGYSCRLADLLKYMASKEA